MTKNVELIRRVGANIMNNQGVSKEAVIKTMVTMAISNIPIEELKKLINYSEKPADKNGFTEMSGQFLITNE